MRKPSFVSRSSLVFVHDVVMAGASFVVSLYLRLGDRVLLLPVGWLAFNTVLFAACAAVVFRVLGLYRGLWRYASLNDLIAITKAVTLTMLVYLPLTFVITRLDMLPRSLIVIQGLVLMVMIGAPRFGYRLFKDGRLDLRRNNGPRVPTLLIGAGDGAEMFVRAMDQPGGTYRVLGIIETERARVGYRMHGITVVGHVDDDLAALITRMTDEGERPQRLVITSDNLSGDRVSALLELSDKLGIALSRLPKLTEFKHGFVNKIEVRPIALEDLLNRPQSVLDRAGMRELIQGRTVLVTGAGGSIGSELVRQISDFGPKSLLLVDNSEYQLYLIDMEIAERHPTLPRHPVLADVRDREKIHTVLAAARPDLVFHAAALKHVPMVEMHPTEGVLTNVQGSRNLADACRTTGVRAMVMVSTDKAVNPTNVMGATKRLAESYCQALDLLESDRNPRTRFVTVRFGNVLGSTGSVVPLFQKQLAKGGPLTVTHPDIERYFMTVREAVELILQASVLRTQEVDGAAAGGRLFVLDMGDPVRIVDLAKQMIRLAGLRPGTDVEIAFTGMRPGEKLREELFHTAEELVPTAAKGIQLASPRTVDHALLSRAIDALVETARRGRVEETLTQLRQLVPEYEANTPARPPSAEGAGERFS